MGSSDKTLSQPFLHPVPQFPHLYNERLSITLVPRFSLSLLIILAFELYLTGGGGKEEQSRLVADLQQ